MGLFKTKEEREEYKVFFAKFLIDVMIVGNKLAKEEGGRDPEDTPLDIPCLSTALNNAEEYIKKNLEPKNIFTLTVYELQNYPILTLMDLLTGRHSRLLNDN